MRLLRFALMAVIILVLERSISGMALLDPLLGHCLGTALAIFMGFEMAYLLHSVPSASSNRSMDRTPQNGNALGGLWDMLNTLLKKGQRR